MSAQRGGKRVPTGFLRACVVAAGIAIVVMVSTASASTARSSGGSKNFEVSLGGGRVARCGILVAPGIAIQARCDGYVNGKFNGPASLVGGNRSVISKTEKECAANQRKYPEASSILGGLIVTNRGAGYVDCVGDATDPGSMLKSGHSVTVAPFTCSVNATGLTCTDTQDGHGFLYGRSTWRTF